MSFGYGVGDVVAVLGLFERIALELRNYRDVPEHFTRLSTGLDFIRGTMKLVLDMIRENDTERDF